ncbi:PAQR family membrane homeostasis protein TrhA [Pediococcus cellicola]|uniref:Hemolysin III n=1 Tax=Pediococcus cellicola TaxID=319652 RepID=A0A0R2ILR1_9LACO|nr:hemolysin III family protein [Pediococcus cellicola]KRN65864.1 hemolysin III [Pediococcus cellicola]GEL15678.1 membrane protein [Pediococcus cellicola]
MKPSTQLQKLRSLHHSQLLNEIWSAITHGLGFFLSIAGTVLLIIKAVRLGQPLDLVAYTIYSISLLVLFFSSTMFHSLYFTKASHVFQILDHDSINLLIAGTYTPYCLLAIRGPLGIGLCIVIWLLAIGGIIFQFFAVGKFKKVETLIYVLMGWLCLVGAKPLYETLGLVGISLLAAGGIAFSLGGVIYNIPHVKYVHVWWHVLVLVGAALMYFSILLYI